MSIFTSTKALFDDLPRRPAEHFSLYFYAAIWNVIEQTARSLGSHKAAFEQFPFLAGYHDELTKRTLPDSWEQALEHWERDAREHLPLLALRRATALDHSGIILLMSIGMVEEDARFGQLFESMHGTGGQHRPTIGLLNAWWRASSRGDARQAAHQLQQLGLVQVINPEAPRGEWALQCTAVTWDALRGERPQHPAAWLEYRQPCYWPSLTELILPQNLDEVVTRVAALLESGEAPTLIVRGSLHNSRRTLAGAMANSLGRGTLTVLAPLKNDDERWRVLGSMATLMRAVPVVVLDVPPGECAEIPAMPGYGGPIAVVLGKHGGLMGAGVERALTLTLDMPDPDTRRRHWIAAIGPDGSRELDTISERFRITAGNIRRAAALGRVNAKLDHRAEIRLADVQLASRSLNRQTLETLASRVNVSGHWGQLAVAAHTLAELSNLESRCRHREGLPGALGACASTEMNTGVRALFTGPSGTGKTLAARILASVLQMDLYRLDLSSIVNKYIGETEKNLNRLFSRAEELDLILLLDEGDALLTQRTGVSNSNDRYANLETNYLLQRLDSYEGILIVTSNAGERIDRAFQRRMDIVVDFRPPEAAERWAIWQLHLPPMQLFDTALLQDIAGRCALSGGQIRNAAVHAALLALEDGGVMTASHLEAGVQREYQKIGAVCPLRRMAARAS